jgi:hypothetical protein
VTIAVEQVNKSMRPTNAKTAMERRSLRKRKSSKLKLIRDLLMEKNTFSTESLMSILIKRQEMFVLL